MSHNYALLLAYDGTQLYGWQKTRMGPSVEESLEKALYHILRTPIPLQAASRTDRGVHARGQVVQFTLEEKIDPYKLLQGLNALLPPQIRALKLRPVSPTFHPTLDALQKTYSYQICLGPTQLPHHRYTSWHRPQLKSIPDMHMAIPHLLGNRDFQALCNMRKDLNYDDYTRTIHSIDLEELPHKRLRITITADRFLYKMARNIVGLLVGAGEGKVSLDNIHEILSSKNRKEAHVTAPAHGLSLDRIYYAGVDTLVEPMNF